MKSLNISNAIVATNSYKLDTLKEIEERIFCIRGVQVMIDNDLADFYGVETKRLNEQVKRNIERFPAHYMFQLTKEEQIYYDSLRSQIATLDNLKSQFATSSIEQNRLRSQIATSKKGGNRYLSYTFTEQGVSMLTANTLKKLYAYERDQ